MEERKAQSVHNDSFGLACAMHMQVAISEILQSKSSIMNKLKNEQKFLAELEFLILKLGHVEWDYINLIL